MKSSPFGPQHLAVFTLRNRSRARPAPPGVGIGAVAFALAAAVSIKAMAFGHQAPAAPPQKFYKEWTMAELLPSVADLGSGRDWAQGRDLFRKAACGVCHAFGRESEGTGLAPDLTGAASTFTREFILQSILEPSATINGRFFNTTFTLKNGEVVTGSVVDTAEGKIFVAPVMMNPQATVEVVAANVKSEEPSSISPMPPGLINELTREQVVELMAFIDAGGDRNAAVYRKK